MTDEVIDLPVEAPKKLKTLAEVIRETNCDEIRAQFPDAPYAAYDYQCAVYRLTGEELRQRDPLPGLIVAAVSAGKTTMISMVTGRIQAVNQQRIKAGQEPVQALVISRQGEIIEQDAEEMWSYKVQNSTFCAGLGKKSTHFPIITGSEKTVANALLTALKDEKFVPMFMFIDEAHMVSVDDYCDSEYRKITDEDGTERTGETWDEMLASKRMQYTIIIRELQRRCRAKYGKELRLIGYTGSPYRNNQLIINEDLNTPGLWRKRIIDIDTEFLVSVGAVVPTRFGDTAGLGYDLSAFSSRGAEGDDDFTAEELRAMEREIKSQGSLTQKIMLDVQARVADRNCVLVTCAGKKHCEEAAAALAPGTSYIIITDDMPQKMRIQEMRNIKEGKYKYTFQVGCLTTGVNAPLWDTNVFLRRIGSITLLIQLVGRTMRILRASHVAQGFTKTDALVLDYSMTMDNLGKLYFDPIIDQYLYQQATFDDDWITCPICEEAGRDSRNSKHARRCIQVDHNGERCEHFFKFRVCEDELHPSTGKRVKVGCGAQNDIAARFCRNCGGRLIDPNKKLTGVHYKDGEFFDVLEFDLKLTKDQLAIYLEYKLKDPAGGSFTAREIIMPGKNEPWIKNVFVSIVGAHVADPAKKKEIIAMNNALKIMGMKHFFRAPVNVSHRRVGEGKGKDAIVHKTFAKEEF